MSTASKVNLVLLALLTGAYMPWNMGLLFLDPLIIVTYAGLALFYAGATPGGDPLRTGLFGAAYSTLVIALGVVSVNLGLKQGAPVLPVLPVSIATPLLSFSAATFAATWARDHIARRNPPHDAASRIRWLTLILLMAWVMRASFIPAAIRDVAAPATTTRGVFLLALGASGVMLAAARRIAGKTPSA